MTLLPAPIPLRRISDHLVEVLLLASLVVIFYFTLFPFDFAFSSWRQMARELATKFDMQPSLALMDDIKNNVLMFMPLGFCIAALAVRRVRWWWVFAIAATSGGAISTLVEVLQAFLGRRNSQINDVLANATGALVGAAVLMAVHVPLTHVGRAVVHWLRHRPALCARFADAGRVALLAAWVGWLMVNIYVPIRLYHAGWMIFWVPSHPLIIGDEATGNRAFDGTVRQVSMAQRAASAEEAAKLAGGEPVARVFGADLLFDFDLQTATPGANPALVDRADPSRKLHWRGSPARTPQPDGARVGPGACLICPDMQDVTNRLIASEQFTIVVDAASADLMQKGPARIMGLSASPSDRNVTIGQEKRALIVRIRFPLTGVNGGDPELMLDDVFTDTSPRRIVVTYNASVARVFVQGPPGLPPRNEVIRFVPELGVMWRLFPRCGWVFRMGTSAVPVYQVLYRVMVFGALGALLAVAAVAMNIRGRWRMARFLVVGWIVPTALIEYIQTWSDGRFDAGPATVGVVIGMTGSLVGWLWARRLFSQASRRGERPADLAGATSADQAGNEPAAP